MIGFGDFDIQSVIDKIKCELCPYKSQNLYFTVECRDIFLKHCIYSITKVEHVEGTIFK